MRLHKGYLTFECQSVPNVYMAAGLSEISVLHSESGEAENPMGFEVSTLENSALDSESGDPMSLEVSTLDSAEVDNQIVAEKKGASYKVRLVLSWQREVRYMSQCEHSE